jgi:hypothetical protein
VAEPTRTSLGPIEPVRMPKNRGVNIPCPVRYACGLGHLHPSRRHAMKCRDRFWKNEAARHSVKKEA